MHCIYYTIFYVLFLHGVIIVRVRSGQERKTETIHLLILRTSPRTEWFEGHHIDDFCVYFQILFFYLCSCFIYTDML